MFVLDPVGSKGSRQQSQQKPRSAGHSKTHPSSDGNQLSDGARSSNRGRHQQQQSTPVNAGNRRRPYPSQYYSRGGYSYSDYPYNDNYYAYGNQRYSDRQGSIWSLLVLTSMYINFVVIPQYLFLILCNFLNTPYAPKWKCSFSTIPFQFGLCNNMT